MKQWQDSLRKATTDFLKLHLGMKESSESISVILFKLFQSVAAAALTEDWFVTVEVLRLMSCCLYDLSLLTF